MPEDEIRRLHTIAMLHDIGKIGIDSKILNKKSSLSDDEFEKMKEHTVIGGKILKELTIIPQVDAGANYHHERFDGRGYPEVIYERLSLVNIFIILYFSFILLLCLIL